METNFFFEDLLVRFDVVQRLKFIFLTKKIECVAFWKMNCLVEVFYVKYDFHSFFQDFSVNFQILMGNMRNPSELGKFGL